MEIESYLHIGKENAISRNELSRLTHRADREIRNDIKEANIRLEKFSDYRILSSSKNRGYWLTNDVSEMEEYIKESEHRISQQRKNDNPIYSLVGRCKGG
ncbi:hypothetical protein [Caproicibacterium sp. BJN0003]|uniref:hypothetical protein n=1 Tax=Caproicibacterium sp. BJN0003 TaxID=2994078 RepID=UPI00224E0FC1|nr:hypothetical protein [Caproicibacterium sp. BJN0003]UZT82125.1 hypothetical protein OP489_11765 [Caproicibacterium sp. BJN0003]